MARLNKWTLALIAFGWVSKESVARAFVAQNEEFLWSKMTFTDQLLDTDIGMGAFVDRAVNTTVKQALGIL